MEVINKYFDKLNNEKKKRKTWNRKKPAKINLITTILIIFKFCLLNVLAFEIQGSFKYCNTNENDMKILDSSNLCQKPRSDMYSKTSKKALVLSKLHDKADGLGFECSMTRYTKYFEETYFLQKHVDSYVENIKLNKGDCEHMILT
jgi:hypothetical protein